MQQTVNPSLQELRRETEQIRVGLTQTVERLKTPVSETASDLRQRISPEATKRKDRAMSAQGANGLFMMSPPPRVEPHTTSHGGRGKCYGGKRTQEAASQGFEAAKSAAEEIIHVARQEDAEGLPPNELKSQPENLRLGWYGRGSGADKLSDHLKGFLI
jgi:hypothetical protein